MRKLAAAAAAVPVVLLVLIPSFLRLSHAARLTLSIGLGALLGLSALGVMRPTGTTARPPSRPTPPSSAAVRTDLQVGLGRNAPVAIAFATPMDATSVAASLTVQPATDVSLSWNAAQTSLAVRPRDGWALGRYHTITIDAGALATSGRPLTEPVRAAFLTRSPTRAGIAATGSVATGLRLDTAFAVSFDRPVDASSVEAAFRIEPALDVVLDRPAAAADGELFVFRPLAPLAAGVEYRVWLDGSARDAEGSPVVGAGALVGRTLVAPAVVRFRPRDGTDAVVRSATLSVRFTQAMDPAATKAAFSVTAAGKPVAGTVTFAENGTVLVFDPKAALGAGQAVAMTVSTAARSATGVPLGAATTGRFVTARAGTAPRAPSTPIPASGSIGTGAWTAVEAYYLKLMNCTRGGGWVSSGGTCQAIGARPVPPLVQDAGISAAVSRPYAKLLATRGTCNHFIGGTPGDRLRRAGYTSYIWAENLGCRSGNPFTAVLGSHRFFQNEKNDGDPTDHFTNLMSGKYDRAGIGVWVAAGRVRLVVDFYHPR